jgi:hypothetical protein
MGSRCASSQRVVLDFADRPGCEYAPLYFVGHRPHQPIPAPRWTFFWRWRDARVPPSTTAHALGFCIFRERFFRRRCCCCYPHAVPLCDIGIAQEKGHGRCGEADTAANIVFSCVPGAADGPSEGETACERECVVEAYFGGCGGAACDVCLEGEWEWALGWAWAWAWAWACGGGRRCRR